MEPSFRGHGFRVGLHGDQSELVGCPAEYDPSKKTGPPGMTMPGTVVCIGTLGHSMEVNTRTASAVADFFFMISPRVADRADPGSLARGRPFFDKLSEMV